MEQEIIYHHFDKITHLKGDLLLPGDKSISHRALIFSAISNGRNEIKNLSSGEDVKSTISCLNQLGVSIYKINDLTFVDGRGFKGLSPPDSELFAGNSGTTARLLSGLLAVQDFPSIITGDTSLSKRPMLRVMEPLRTMGADIRSESGNLPLKIYPSQNLDPADFKMTIPSAQVKSAVILAGIHLEQESRISEYMPSRDHTERMLGLHIIKEERRLLIHFSKKNYPEPTNYIIPSDISTAVFFIVLALLTPDSEIRLKNVSLNPSRSGIIEILKQMGGEIYTENFNQSSNEPFGDLIVKSSKLRNIEINPDIIPNIIDEIPALTIAGIFAEGNFSIIGAGELRYKESDRISAICQNLKQTGLYIDEYIDGFSISGEMVNNHFIYNSFGDHRIAMAFSVLAMLSEKGGEIEDFGCVKISNPDFINQIDILTR